MRRPAAACGAGFSAGIAACSQMGNFSALLAGAGFLLLFLCSRWKMIEKYIVPEKEKRHIAGRTEHGAEEEESLLTSGVLKKTAVIFLLFFAAGSFRYAVSGVQTSPFEGRNGTMAEITGIVLSEEVREDKSLLELSVKKQGILREKILVTVKKAEGEERSRRSVPKECLTGRRVSVRGVLREPESQGNPGVFDYRRYLESCGIRMTMQADQAGLSVCGTPEGIGVILSVLEKFRRNYLNSAAEVMDEEAAGLLAGIMFGDRTRMDEEIYSEFQKNGTAHLLAVSGLHISMIYGLLAAISGSPMTLRGNLPAAVMLVLYAALSGFSPSVVRAVFMILTQITARILHRRYDGLSGISFCAFSLLLYRPAMLFSAGFQLSFLAVLTICIVMPSGTAAESGIRKQNRKERMKEYGKKQAADIFLIQAGMMPVTLYQFHYISPAAFLLNPPAIALAGFIVPAGVVMMPFSAVGELKALPDFVERTADTVFHCLCMAEEMLLSLLTFINGLPEGTIFRYRYMASPPSGVLLLYYLLLFFFFSESGRDFMRVRELRLRRGICVLLIFAVISGSAGFYSDRAGRAGELVFLDVGQGDCAHLKDGFTHILFDSGGSDTYDVGENILLPYFLSGGTSEIDLAVISHLHTDHCGALTSLIKGVRIRKMMLSAVYEADADKISETYGIPKKDLLFVREGDRISAGNVTLEVLAPARGSAEEYRKLLENGEDENELCLIVRAEYKGRKVLFTGDIGAEYEEKLTELHGERLNADILKVAHHGSRYSTCSTFLSAVSPVSAVIQVGTNYYGHPSEEVLERLDNAGVSVFRNDRDGAVFADMESGKLTAMRELKRVFFRD